MQATVSRLRSALPALLIAAMAFGAIPARAVDLPAATEKTLRDLKLSPSIMQGLDKELDVPKAWIDAAKREGVVKVSGSWSAAQFTELNTSFRERYPEIKLDYSVGTFNARAIRPLIAFKEGRSIVDIMTGFGGSVHLYQEANALEDLRSLPGFKNPIPGTGDPEGGTWVAMRLRYWCVSYNTNKVNKNDLPKTWDDLLTNPVWRNGNLAIPDIPSIWLTMLWDANGEAWTTNFMIKLFTVVKPQLRKEGTNAVVGLTAAGETPAFIGAADYRVKEHELKGAPVSWHCPEPVPVGVSQLMMLKGSPAPNGSLIFLNWFLSKEGQLAQYVGDNSIPVHKDMESDPRFLPYPDEVIGKKLAIRDEEKIRLEFPKLMAVYGPLWTGAGGAPLSKEAE